MNGLGIIAGKGALPRLIARDRAAQNKPTLIIDFQGIEVDWADEFDRYTARFEQPEALFEALRNAGCGSVVMAGAMQRPALDPAQFDQTFAGIAPLLMEALRAGDDAALKVVLEMFEAAGFGVIGAQDALASLSLEPGCPTIAQPTDYDRADAERALEILAVTGPLDVGQGAVVAGGLCLGLETLQGTSALLDFVKATDSALRPARGLLVKAPKSQQDQRVDLPSIGPDTMDQLAAAHLSGVVIQAGAALVIDQEEVIRRADKHGLFVWSKA